MCFASASQMTFSTTLRRSTGSAHGQQRGHVGHAARRHAPLRFATQRSSCPTSPLGLFWQSVVSVSGESGVPLSPGLTMSRLADASPPAASLRGLAATGSSVAMWGRQSLRLVATPHHHLRFASMVASVSAHSSASLCARAWEVHRQCFASVGQCAVAQIGCRLAYASCWVRCCQQRGHAGPSVAALGGNPASPLGGVRLSGVPVSARGDAAPRAGAVEVHRQCCARWQSERCGAACRLVSLAHRGWQVVSGPWWCSPLRQSYITPHCMK